MSLSVGPNAPVMRMRAWIIVILLTLAYLLSYVDRQILALLIEPIKVDLGIDDLRFSLLTGFAFSVFFAIAGLPLGWASDTFKRNRVIFAGIFCWSLATIGSGLAENYGQIFLARILVGVGEAALTPAAYSLLADVIAPAMLGRAIAVFSMGSQFGAATAYLLGSVLIAKIADGGLGIPLLDALPAWKQLFVIVGLPGLLLGPLILFAVRDPRAGGGGRKSSLNAAWGSLADKRPFLIAHYTGYTALAASFFAMMAWLPAVLTRRLSLDPAHLGWTAGVMVLFCCPPGTLAAGWLADKLSRGHGRQAPFLASLIGIAVMIPAMILVILGNDGPLLMVGLCLALFVAPWPLVHASLALQTVIPSDLRAQVTALFLLIANLVGQTGGVSSVALMTDKLWADPQKVHLSLALICLFSLALAIWPLRRALHHAGAMQND